MNEARSNDAFRRFVPEQLLKLLNKGGIEQLRLDDHVQLDMTVLFSDIRSFTTLSERLTPEQNFRFLNSYLSKMEPSIERYGGFIDKFIGDSIMALFGTSADDAVRSALDMTASLREYNLGRLRAGYEPIRIGIGLNSGPLMLGIVGGENRLQGTVIGDAVNVASRVEDLNKTYGTSLLLTGHTLERLADPSAYRMRRIDTVQVRGRSRAERIYELFDADAPEVLEKKLATAATFEEAMKRYEEGRLPEARELFRDVYARNRYDLVSRAYIERCDAERGASPPEPAPAPSYGATVAKNERRFAALVAPRPSGGRAVGGAAADSRADETAPSVLIRLAEATRIYLTHHLGFPPPDEEGVVPRPEWAPSVDLCDLTACVFLEGAVGGGLAVTADVAAGLALLHRMSYGGWDASEEIPLMSDALGETLNIVAGNSLRLFQHYVDFVTIEPPVVRRTPGETLTPPAGAWRRSLRFGDARIDLIAFE